MYASYIPPLKLSDPEINQSSIYEEHSSLQLVIPSLGEPQGCRYEAQLNEKSPADMVFMFVIIPYILSQKA